MKNISCFIIEKLNASPYQMMHIWKGKNTDNLDIQYLNNPKNLIHEIINVHRHQLPTEEEFMNLCEWLIANTNFTAVEFEYLIDKMLEVFVPNKYAQQSSQIKSLKIYQTPSQVTKNFIGDLGWHNNKTAYTLLEQGFFIIHKLIKRNNDIKQKHTSDEDPNHDDYINLMIEFMGETYKKWHKNVDTWPDYSKSLDMVVKYINK